MPLYDNCMPTVCLCDRSWIGTTHGIRDSREPDAHSHGFPVDVCHLRLLLVVCGVQRSAKVALFGRHSHVVHVSAPHDVYHQSVHWIQTLVSGIYDTVYVVQYLLNAILVIIFCCFISNLMF